MYIILFIILMAIAVGIIIHGFSTKHKVRIGIGVVLGVFTLFLFWFMRFWGEVLWFEAIGYPERFWTIILSKLWLAIAGGLLGAIALVALTWTIPREKRLFKIAAPVIGAFIGIQWGFANWDTILRYLNRVSTQVSEPILGKDVAFYLFRLPLYDNLYSLALWLSIVALLIVVLAQFLKIDLQREKVELREGEASESPAPKRFQTISRNAAVIVFILAWGIYLRRYHLLYSGLGVVNGPGWTDDHIRLPAYLLISILTVLFGLVLAISPLRKRIFQRFKLNSTGAQLGSLGTFAGLIAIIWFVSLSIVPALFQWLRVEPNEISFEEPYIAHNIEFTRQGFKLNSIEEREFPVTEEFSQKIVENNRHLFSNIRLWDWRALDEVYEQFQEIRLYYEFTDVDIDRYTIDGAYRAVMVSAREMNLSNLPTQSQTFVNRRFKYTHGYGLTLTTVSEFTPQGLPHLLIKDIPPQHESPELEVKEPRIYYGELTDSHVIANSEEEEFDYPSGEQNMYTSYSGNGGVQLSNIWRKFLFGWKFDGTRLFLSGYPTTESRIMFHRNIKERARLLAPFLEFDDDPYIVLADGKLYWILDAYTTSQYYPYSEPFASGQTPLGYSTAATRQQVRTRSSSLAQINYIRNSVKVVIDAFHGTTDFYIFDEDDPLIQVWQKIFPELFTPRDDMPDALVQHIRYPSKMLLTQGLVYAKYHMSEPTVFYNQEDLWIRATEKYHNQVQPVDPYYIMWEPPQSDTPEFILMLPFTPKERQVLIGWIAGMCDPENYGRLLAYKFPKEKRVLGPQQVETKIDQDSFLSGQLTLWDQRGSNVLRGNVLVIPIEETVLYVEPIYLQAETAAYPELRLVAVMHNDNLSYAETFDEALRGLFGEGPPPSEEQQRPVAGTRTFDTLIQDANTAFEDYLNALGEKRFNAASDSLQSLEQALQELLQQTAETGNGVME